MHYIQKTYEYSADVAESLRDGKKVDLQAVAPTRQVSTESDTAKRQLEQTGFDIVFQEMIKQHLERVRILEANLKKAYALIYASYCSKVIQNRIEEHHDYETKIRDDPIELLKAIESLMHDTVRAKYPFASLTTALETLLHLKQQDNENLLDYIKRFKQVPNVVNSHVDNDSLEKSIEKNQEYKDLNGDTAKEDAMKKNSMEQWMAYIFIRSCDQAKYGSLLTG